MSTINQTRSLSCHSLLHHPHASKRCSKAFLHLPPISTATTQLSFLLEDNDHSTASAVLRFHLQVVSSPPFPTVLDIHGISSHAHPTLLLHQPQPLQRTFTRRHGHLEHQSRAFWRYPSLIACPMDSQLHQSLPNMHHCQRTISQPLLKTSTRHHGLTPYQLNKLWLLSLSVCLKVSQLHDSLLSKRRSLPTR